MNNSKIKNFYDGTESYIILFTLVVGMLFFYLRHYQWQ